MVAGGIRGFVEARSPEAILGWAWDASRSDMRLSIALRDGETCVSHAIADLPREDLAQSGIGDGAHAFRFDLSPELAARAEALAVVVLDPTGAPILLEAAPRSSVVSVETLTLARLQRGLEQ